MNFELDQVELAVVETVEKLAREVIQPRAQHYDETETFCESGACPFVAK